MSPFEAMLRAIQEGEYGLGRVHPNPPVGCVVLDKNNSLLATGRHEVFGGDHAEINALKKIIDPESLKGSKWFVTLEPCAHEGKTPSCAKKLATLPIAELTYGIQDPNPKVSGQGAKILSNAGIAVAQYPKDDLVVPLNELCEIFLWNMKTQLPFIAIKVATSLDGQVAHKSGESQWITNEASRNYSHFLRAQYDAIAIGKNSIIKDNPKLNVRHDDFHKTNKVIVFDSEAETLSQELNILKCREAKYIFYVVKDIAKHSDKAKKLGVKLLDLNLGLKPLLEELYHMGVSSILVEGGGRLQSSFLTLGLAQRLYQFIGSSIIGSESGLSWTQNLNLDSFSKRIQLSSKRVKEFNGDIFITGRL
jgi:diaminohydroxyphosphoribosylaminopyrimidine deaminase/5-amino-6-(5-phosphoribosylamino)uracil reductase